MPTNVSGYGTLRTKTLNVNHVKSGWRNATPSILNLRAGNADGSLNQVAFINLELAFEGEGKSTLKTVEYETDGQTIVNPFTALNMVVKGIKNPAADYDAATKKYVDDKITNYIQTFPPVKAFSDTQIDNKGGFGYATTGGTGGRGKLELNAGGGSPITSKINGASMVMDNQTVTTGQAVLFTNTKNQGATGSNSDGVWVLDTVQNGPPECIFSRRDDMPGPLARGTFIRIDPGAIHSGNGYYLNAAVANEGDVRPYLLFSTAESRSFGGVIGELANGKWSVLCDTGGGDAGAVLTVGASEGIADWEYTIGKTDEDFIISSAAFTATDSGTWTHDSVGLTCTVPAFKFECITGARTVKFIGTGGANQYLGNTMEFSTATGGTPPRVLGSGTTPNNVRADGHLAAMTNVFNSNASEEFGAGVLFDCVNATSNSGGNDNQDNLCRYLMVPHKDASNAMSIDIVHFATGSPGTGAIIAQLAP